MGKRGAAAVIIGNEVLTAKVVEQNGAHLIRRLRERGVPLRSVQLVPDEIDAIVEALTLARRNARWVITSGGIGPTHDDVTVRAVAMALGRQVVRLASMEQLIKDHYADRLSPEALRLADAPEGAELILQAGTWYPVLSCDGVFMLPGVPDLFRAQLEAVLARVEGKPVFIKTLFVSDAEADIAGVLDRVALTMPEVSIGSYPTFNRAAGYKVMLTVEAAEATPVEKAVGRLTAELPAGTILRVE